MVWPVFGSVKTGRPVSQQRFGGAADMLEDGDGLRALLRATAAAATGAESGLDGSGGLISYRKRRKRKTTTKNILGYYIEYFIFTNICESQQFLFFFKNILNST